MGRHCCERELGIVLGWLKGVVQHVDSGLSHHWARGARHRLEPGISRSQPELSAALGVARLVDREQSKQLQHLLRSALYAARQPLARPAVAVHVVCADKCPATLAQLCRCWHAGVLLDVAFAARWRRALVSEHITGRLRHVQAPVPAAQWLL